ncbi:hypothetical protein DSLASN_18210 [Desulfoluna limicola]|uniref:Uncharacterized protein n=1 Tax=Desulfoluna limicola TaxID=2810562 RepID=A0ABN6F5A5_9BACT|nr:hypothetical protein DSLASN_18210 [Desulfoluna limicola]
MTGLRTECQRAVGQCHVCISRFNQCIAVVVTSCTTPINDIHTAAAAEAIVAGPAKQGIVVGTAAEDVITGTRIKKVISGAAIEGIGLLATR